MRGGINIILFVMCIQIYRGAYGDRKRAEKRLSNILGVKTEKPLAFRGVFDIKTGLYIPATKEIS